MKSVTASNFSFSIYHEVMGPDAMILVVLLEFKPAFSLSSFNLIKMLFISSSLSDMRVVSSAYLKLLIFLLANVIPACASSSSAFHLISQVFCRMRLNWSSSALFLVIILWLWSYPSLKGRPQRFSALLIVSREYNIGTSGGPVVKTLYFHCRGYGFHPLSGN